MKKFDVKKLDILTKDFIKDSIDSEVLKSISTEYLTEKELLPINYNYDSYDSDLTIKQIKDIIFEKENTNKKIEEYNFMLKFNRDEFLKELYSEFMDSYLEYVKPLTKLTKKDINNIKNNIYLKNFNYKNLNLIKYIKYIKVEIIYLRRLSISKVKKIDDSVYTKVIQKVLKKKNKEQPPLVSMNKTKDDFTKNIPKSIDDLILLNSDFENKTYLELTKLLDEYKESANKDYLKYKKEIDSINKKNIKYRKKIYHQFMDLLEHELSIDKKELSRLINILYPKVKENLFSYDKKLPENSVSKDFKIFILNLKRTFN